MHTLHTRRFAREFVRLKPAGSSPSPRHFRLFLTAVSKARCGTFLCARLLVKGYQRKPLIRVRVAIWPSISSTNVIEGTCFKFTLWLPTSFSVHARS